MGKSKRDLRGSWKRDAFKYRHKRSLPGSFYATDADLCLVSKSPPGTVAYLDYKDPEDTVTFAEVIQYNEWMAHAPVYIVEGKDPSNGPFTILRYLGGEWRPRPPKVDLEFVTKVENWHDFEAWESNLRQEYSRRNGWGENLRSE